MMKTVSKARKSRIRSTRRSTSSRSSSKRATSPSVGEAGSKKNVAGLRKIGAVTRSQQKLRVELGISDEPKRRSLTMKKAKKINKKAAPIRGRAVTRSRSRSASRSASRSQSQSGTNKKETKPKKTVKK
ncbi:hypothetical protein GCK72_009765 [Caenorhabditis remanei]|uniref:Uncharacterized protein n=1 Tax=Caenorhabditis remanei TaxID=31234 RepID=A0A6A5H3E1_CAERE|nr:hypothetical protein GCK72_009755 [Caenorhabditis remanei]XP_053587102.1 hypothetical protein GCK72_009765 [Caenorhabditis remanei]KAF1761499.1 hypothetical protein GCK72_009755 [Caenorhabditis remanei]KAF1761509.1 hypothetical protein GCK72_009765 [Caenorhabditis remanei]